MKMRLIFCSIFLGFLGFILGGFLLTGFFMSDAGAFMCAAVGFLSPALYILSELYKKSK